MDIQNNAADIPDLTPQSNFQTWAELYDAIEKRIEEIRGMCSISDTPENRARIASIKEPEAMNWFTEREYQNPPKAVDPELEKEKERLAREAYRIAQTHVVGLLQKNPKLLLSLPSEKSDPFIGLQFIQELCINAEKIMEGLKQVEDDPTNSQQRGNFGFHSKRKE